MQKNIAIPTELAPITRIFTGAGVPVYAVGGMVRNALLGLPAADLDVCSPMTPEQLTQACGDTQVRVIPKAVAFGTVELHCGAVRVEHTTFRRENYRPGGAHRPERVELGGTLETDAFRRDFSVNALYAALDTGAVLDPTGGLRDLEQRTLRATGDNPDTIMGSDALRVLRLARFAGELGFAIEEGTLRSAVKNVGKLADVAAERKREELDKLLLCDVRYPTLGGGRERVRNALELLDTLGAWPYLIPAVEACRDCRQRPDHHRYDVLHHLFAACAAAEPTATLRLAALLHDVGKPVCREKNGNLHDHARLGEPIAREAMRQLRYPNATVDRVGALVRNHMYDIQGQAKDSTLRVRFALWGRELTQEMIWIREADIIGCGYDEPTYRNTRWRTLYEQMQHDGTPFCEAELALSGDDIMRALHLSEGMAVGAVKRRLFLHCARHPRDNTKERLLGMLPGIYREAAARCGS